MIHRDLEKSEVYNRDCSTADSWVLIDVFASRLDILEAEAHDLIELQDLLEANVVDFDLLPQYVLVHTIFNKIPLAINVYHKNMVINLLCC